MGNTVVANQADIANLKNQLDNASSDYKSNYAKLQGVVNQVGVDFKGTAADQFKSDFTSLEPTFEGIQSEIDEAHSFMSDEEQKTASLINRLADDMTRRA